MCGLKVDINEQIDDRKPLCLQNMCISQHTHDAIIRLLRQEGGGQLAQSQMDVVNMLQRGNDGQLYVHHLCTGLRIWLVRAPSLMLVCAPAGPSWAMEVAMDSLQTAWPGATRACRVSLLETWQGATRACKASQQPAWQEAIRGGRGSLGTRACRASWLPAWAEATVRDSRPSRCPATFLLKERLCR